MHENPGDSAQLVLGKDWRVFDESDEIGGRFVQAFMALNIGDSTVATTRAEGLALSTRLPSDAWRTR